MRYTFDLDVDDWIIFRGGAREQAQDPDFTSSWRRVLGELINQAVTADANRPVDLPPVTKATEIEPGKQYLIQVDEGQPMSQEIADRILAKLKDRFPTNTFAIAGGFSVAEIGLPEAVYTPVVMRDDLVDALKRAEGACGAQWTRAQTEGDHTVYAAAGWALSELRKALLNPQRDGSGGQLADEGAATPDPAAQTTPGPSPIRPMEITWPGDLDPDDRASIAQQLDAIGHSSGLTYWNDVAKAIRSIRAPR